MVPASPPSHGPSSEPPVVIVGAGLAGCLMATLLARRGLPVHLYERREDLRAADISAGRSINLALSTRGIRALSAAGLAEQILADAIPMAGRMMHAVDGELTFQPYGRQGQAINSVSRRGLNCALMDAAEAAGCRLFFGHRCSDVDVATGRVRFAAQGAEVHVDSRLCIGADGINSAVRAAMHRQPGFAFDEIRLQHGYKELCIPPAADGGFRLEPEALHIWPRHDFMLIALPNADRTFTCTLFMALQGAEGLRALQTPGQVQGFFDRHFPDAVPHMPTLVQDWQTNPTSELATIACAPYAAGDRVALVGDAAHAVVPFYGQGMNAAFESCRLLDEQLSARTSAGPWCDDQAAALQAYAAGRKADADAIRQLALDNFLEMRSKVANPLFLWRKRLDKLLARLLPGRYLPLYSMVTFSDIPYAEAVDRARVQDAALTVLAGGLAVGALLALVSILQ